MEGEGLFGEEGLGDEYIINSDGFFLSVEEFYFLSDEVLDLLEEELGIDLKNGKVYCLRWEVRLL